MIRTLLTRALALCLLCALVLAAAHYPVNQFLMGGGLAVYAGLLWWRPQLWLLIVPALLPVFDLAPWTGWFFLEELDLLLLATCALLYWRIGARTPTASLPVSFTVSLLLVAAAFAVATVIGLGKLPAIDANSFSNYNSPYNSLRIAKGLAWALLLLPLLRRSAGEQLVDLHRYFIPGMLLGLAGTSLCVIWERGAFPGLLNFASDYRPTAPFSAMHTGGAALDAYLGISFPFVAAWLLNQDSTRKSLLAMTALLLGCYAGLTTFSRDIYLAYGSAVVILATLGIAYRLRRRALRMGQVIAAAVLLALFAYAFTRVMASSGYRGLLAALLLAMAALIVGIGPRVHRPMLAGAAAGALLLVVAGLFAIVGKGAYLGFGLASAIFGVAAVLYLMGRPEARLLGPAALPAMAAAALLVAYHWTGTEAVVDTAIVVVLSFGLLALNRTLAAPIWQLNRASLTGLALCGVVFAMTIPVAGSYYAGSRFATVSNDIDVRLRHWQEGLDMRAPGLSTALFGMGLGRYPDTYFWHNTHGETPGSYSYQQEAKGERSGNLHLRLGTAQYAQGGGDVLRMLQHLEVEPQTRYRIKLDARRVSDKAVLTVHICQRWLLYPDNCKNMRLGPMPADGQWHAFEGTIDSGSLGTPGLFARPVQLEMSADGRASYVDVDNLSVSALGVGPELVKNGGFSAANDYWFFSSDRNHFPWHAKNVVVYTLFELGWFGLAALGLMLLGVAGSLVGRALYGDSLAAVYLASLAGFLVVGLFDSLFDVPRLTLVFFLVTCVASLAPAVPKKRRRRRSATGSDSEQAAASSPVP